MENLLGFFPNIHLRKIISEYIKYEHLYIDELNNTTKYLNDATNVWIFYENKSIKREHSKYACLTVYDIGGICKDKHKYEKYLVGEQKSEWWIIVY
jgi:hypothetical protein